MKKVFNYQTGKIFKVFRETSYNYAFSKDGKCRFDKDLYIILNVDSKEYQQKLVEFQKPVDTLQKQIDEIEDRIEKLNDNRYDYIRKNFCRKCSRSMSPQKRKCPKCGKPRIF